MQLTLRQRLGLDAVTALQKGSRKEVRIYKDILDKLEVTNELRDQAFRILPSGQVIEDVALLDGLLIEVAFEKEERRRLLELIDAFTHFGPKDSTWVDPVARELEKSL